MQIWTVSPSFLIQYLWNFQLYLPNRYKKENTSDLLKFFNLFTPKLFKLAVYRKVTLFLNANITEKYNKLSTQCLEFL